MKERVRELRAAARPTDDRIQVSAQSRPGTREKWSEPAVDHEAQVGKRNNCGVQPLFQDPHEEANICEGCHDF